MDWQPLADALRAYDACPRIESKYKPAYAALREAAIKAGMPRYYGGVVEWSRNNLPPAPQDAGGES